MSDTDEPVLVIEPHQTEPARFAVRWLEDSPAEQLGRYCSPAEAERDLRKTFRGIPVIHRHSQTVPKS